jgi:hypothetical protein
LRDLRYFLPKAFISRCFKRTQIYIIMPTSGNISIFLGRGERLGERSTSKWWQINFPSNLSRTLMVEVFFRFFVPPTHSSSTAWFSTSFGELYRHTPIPMLGTAVGVGWLNISYGKPA